MMEMPHKEQLKQFLNKGFTPYFYGRKVNENIKEMKKKLKEIEVNGEAEKKRIEGTMYIN